MGIKREVENKSAISLTHSLTLFIYFLSISSGSRPMLMGKGDLTQKNHRDGDQTEVVSHSGLSSSKVSSRVPGC